MLIIIIITTYVILRNVPFGIVAGRETIWGSFVNPETARARNYGACGLGNYSTDVPLINIHQ